MGDNAQDAYASASDMLEQEFRLLHGPLDAPEGARARVAHLARLVDALDGEATPTALCLSGGGIRSATFSLGVVQALACNGLLGRFHYLSTVSGGGYLGGWLSSWIARHPHGLDGVIQALNGIPAATGATAGVGDASAPETFTDADGFPDDRSSLGGPWPVERLRAYSNYLSPVWGASVDAFTLAATFLRNLCLHWSALMPLLVAAIVLARLVLIVGRLETVGVALAASLGALALALSFVTVAYIGADLPGPPRPGAGTRRPGDRFGRYCLAPLLVAAILFSWLASWDAPDIGARPTAFWDASHRLPRSWWTLAAFSLGGATLHLSAALIGAGWRWRRGLQIRRYTYPQIAIVTALATGAFGGAGLLVFLCVVCRLGRAVTTDWAYAMLAVPALLLVFWFTLTFYAGLARRLTNEDDREWWSRASAITLLATVGWIVFMALAVGAAEVAAHLGGSGNVGFFALASGAISSAWGFWGRRGAAIKRATQGVVDKLGLHVLQLAALGFVVLLVVGFGVMAESGLTPLGDHVPFETSGPAAAELWAHAGVLLLAALVGFCTNYFVGVNTFSLHSMYGNRIVRAYLGGTNRARRPHWFTGFDPLDNLSLASLLPKGAPGTRRLFHVVNVALNLAEAAGDRLEWQQRKAAPFTLSPTHCGSALLGYVATGDYARTPAQANLEAASAPGDHLEKPGITLGRAIAISGAAASPNMGYHTSTLVAFAMSFFNVRLGWWLPNPERRFSEDWRKEEPDYGLFNVLSEAFARTGEDHSFVYLSDGGHFENLGLYEMVRRRCRRIVLVDASQDGEFRYADLESALRKIRIDLGVEIEFPLGLPTAATARRLRAAHAFGVLRYPNDGARGLIVYVKPALCGDEPLDVQRYAAQTRGRAANPFPHDPTLRQAFDEAQFESYRALGLHCAGKAFATPDLWSFETDAWPDHRKALEELASEADRPPGAPQGKADETPAPPRQSGLLASAVLVASLVVSGALALHGRQPPDTDLAGMAPPAAGPTHAALKSSLQGWLTRLQAIDAGSTTAPAPQRATGDPP